VKRLVGAEDGSGAVEFAFIMPVLALLVGAVIQLGTLAQTAIVASNAAREGARYAAVSDPSAASKALAYLNGTLGTRSDVSMPPLGGITVSGSTVGSPVTVTVPVTVAVQMPVMSKIFGPTIQLTGVAVMEVSQ
jgi:Flp pilus assembly protein TadG